MTEDKPNTDVITVFHCGPQSDKCKCDCAKNPPGICDHRFDGPSVKLENGGSVTCSKCGMTAMNHDMWLFW